MSNEVIESNSHITVIQKAEKHFSNVNTCGLVWKKEAGFAKQALENNDYLMKIAGGNQTSLINAITNIGAIGLTLNPAEKLAYLIPRKGKVCLDVSYMGLIRLATDTGSIMWVRAELVYSNDVLIYHGATEKPEFSSPDPFDRGQLKGVYCVAKTTEGDFLSGIMNLEECHAIRDRSESFKKGSGPWKTDEGEMMKKTIIKRESKTWPKSDKTHRFDNAVEIINEHEGINFNDQVDPNPINWQNVEQGYIRAIECVDCADPLEGSDMARQLMIDLTPDEQVAMNNKLKGYKPGKRQYNTLFSDCLNYDGEVEEPALPVSMQ